MWKYKNKNRLLLFIVFDNTDYGGVCLHTRSDDDTIDYWNQLSSFMYMGPVHFKILYLYKYIIILCNSVVFSFITFKFNLKTHKYAY